MSIPIEKNEEMTPEVRRSPSEIQARIKELREEMVGYDVWIHSGYSARQDPESERKQNLLKAKLGELRWISGEDVRVNDGVY